jgi:hypothetical protein
VIDEPGTQQALALRRHRLFAPDLLVAECGNVLWKKVRRNELKRRSWRLDCWSAPMSNWRRCGNFSARRQLWRSPWITRRMIASTWRSPRAWPAIW